MEGLYLRVIREDFTKKMPYKEKLELHMMVYAFNANTWKPMLGDCHEFKVSCSHRLPSHLKITNTQTNKNFKGGREAAAKQVFE